MNRNVILFASFKSFLVLLIFSAIAFETHGVQITLSPDPAGACPALQQALASAQPGDILRLSPGVYRELLLITNSGGEGKNITIRGEGRVVFSGEGKSLAGQDRQALIRIENAHHVRLEGLELTNLKSDQKGVVPVGILVTGASGDLELVNLDIHHIETLFPEKNGGDAHGLAVYGNQPVEPIRNILIDRVRIHDCKLGSSESMVLNGNVEAFTVQNCEIHDNNNIGIDFIGHEKVCKTPELDQARKGVCRSNLVYNISSYGNPAYGNDRSADGIYVDGGKDILIEHNTVTNCDIGIEIASEHRNQEVSDVIVRGNSVSQSFQAGIMMGGYSAGRGSATRITIENNILTENDRARWNMGELVFQWHVSQSKIIGNTFYPRVQYDAACYISRSSKAVETTNIVFDGNTYILAGKRQQWSLSKDQVANNFADWQKLGHDRNGLLKAASP